MVLPFQWLLARTDLTWNTISQNTDPWTIQVPQFGQDFVLRGQFRSAQASGAAINMQTYINGDTTGANYRFQRYIGANNAAAATQAGAANGAQITGSGGSTPASLYSHFFLICPDFNVPSRQRTMYMVWGLENATLDQQIAITYQKRFTAGTGTLTDAISSITLGNALANAMDGTARYCVTPST